MAAMFPFFARVYIHFEINNARLEREATRSRRDSGGKSNQVHYSTGRVLFIRVLFFPRAREPFGGNAARCRHVTRP